MNKKKISLFYTIKRFKNLELYKDPGMVPYYLSKNYELESNIIYSNEKKIKVMEKFRNIKLKELKYYNFGKIIKKIDKFKILENISFYIYLLKEAKEIDYLMFFHLGIDKFFLILLYKFLNKKGKIYLKLDIRVDSIKFYNQNFKNIFRKIQKKFLQNILKNIDLISCETKECFDEIKENGLCNFDISDKLIYIQNGFDEDYLTENNIKVKKFEEKENIMITVGRIGTEEKNNEMLLKVINKMDLKDWKIYIIGPYTEQFKRYYDDFIKSNPAKKDKVILVGNIEDKNLLYDYYNRAKVFLLTSRWEGFAIVYPEALRFGNYIITTDVGGAKDITNNGEIGVVTEIENEEQYKKEILKVINEEINLEEKYNQSLKWSEEKFLWNNIVKNEKFKEFFTGEN
ncbi:glycosyltransferase family 4 protein [Fusobacterium varium]|uniref:glycosyltransferase family 4 protein n=2 Tax=Fusobacterium varium TaxID=856 RepID=UPI000E42713A|nr:glycosyltransferase [Fusobacterium varium]RGJ28029.1 glycosyltransferase family 1 protein [Fusobacterium varium]